ncbi:unnamed protein product [Urochloa humidicola]
MATTSETEAPTSGMTWPGAACRLPLPPPSSPTPPLPPTSSFFPGAGTSRRDEPAEGFARRPRLLHSAAGPPPSPPSLLLPVGGGHGKQAGASTSELSGGGHGEHTGASFSEQEGDGHGEQAGASIFELSCSSHGEQGVVPPLPQLRSLASSVLVAQGALGQGREKLELEGRGVVARRGGVGSWTAGAMESWRRAALWRGHENFLEPSPFFFAWL